MFVVPTVPRTNTPPTQTVATPQASTKQTEPQVVNTLNSAQPQPNVTTPSVNEQVQRQRTPAFTQPRHQPSYTTRTTYLDESTVPDTVKSKAIPSFKRLLIEMFYTHWDKFTRQMDRTQANAALSAYATRFQIQDLTDHTASILAAEPAIDAKTMKDLISEECSKQIRSQTHRLNKLEQFHNRTANNTAKNLLRGSPYVAQPKQQMETTVSANHPPALKSSLKKQTTDTPVTTYQSTVTSTKLPGTGAATGKKDKKGKPTVAKKPPPKAKHSRPSKQTSPNQGSGAYAAAHELEKQKETGIKPSSKHNAKRRHSKTSTPKQKISWSDKSTRRPEKRSDS
jgi:hypothetical protein